MFRKSEDRKYQMSRGKIEYQAYLMDRRQAPRQGRLRYADSIWMLPHENKEVGFRRRDRRLAQHREASRARWSAGLIELARERLFVPREEPVTKEIIQ